MQLLPLKPPSAFIAPGIHRQQRALDISLQEWGEFIFIFKDRLVMLFAADSRFKQRPLKPTLLSLGGGNKVLLSHQTDIIGEVCFTFKVCQLVRARFFLTSPMWKLFF